MKHLPVRAMTILALTGLALPASPSHAQVPWAGEGQQSDVPNVVELVVDPAAEPRPALRYALMPEYGKLKHGNAVPYYYRAVLSLASTRGRINALPDGERHALDLGMRWSEWSELPLDEFPRDKAGELVGRYAAVVEEMRVAATREECDWELRFRDLEGMEAINFLLGEFQEFRELARLLALKARLEIVEGRPEDAIETLKMGFRLGHDCSKVPTLINDLIGLAIASIMRVECEHLVAVHDCPNLYWAFAAIPEPLVDMRTSLQQEALLAERLFPFLGNASAAEHAPEEWNRIIRDASRQMDEVWGLARLGRREKVVDRVLWELYSAGMLAKAYPQARERLVERGYDREAVERMPVGQVLAIDAQATFRHIRDEMFKWALLPPRQSWRGFQRAEERLREDGYLGRGGGALEVIPIASALLPAVWTATSARLQVERDLRALRIVEALRLHAAETGRFPERLEDVAELPIPDDPWRNAPFPYRLENGTAVLEVLSPEAFPHRGRSRVYRITLRSP